MPSNRLTHWLFAVGVALLCVLLTTLPAVYADKFSVEEFISEGSVAESSERFCEDDVSFNLHDHIPSFRTTAELSFKLGVGLRRGQVFALMLPGYSVVGASVSLYVDDVAQYNRQAIRHDGGSLLDLFKPGNALRTYIDIPRNIVIGASIRIVIHNVLTPPWHFFSKECRDIFSGNDSFITDRRECCDSIRIGVLVSINGSFLYAAVEASKCTVPSGGVVPPPHDHCDTHFIPSICCQFSDYADIFANEVIDERCREYICLETNNLRLEGYNIPYSVECCEYQDVEDYTLHDVCESCTPGNFDSNECCINPVVREQNEFCDRVVCNCDEWTPERCCYGFFDSRYRQDSLCPDCNDVDYFADNLNECCMFTQGSDPRCECRPDRFSSNIGYCCGLAEYEDDARCVEQCEEWDDDEFCPSTCCPMFNDHPRCVDLCFDEPCLCNPSADGCGCPNSIYQSHQLNVSDIRSGGNTVIINHLTVNAYIDNDHECGSGSGGHGGHSDGILPLVVLNVDSSTNDNHQNPDKPHPPHPDPDEPGDEDPSHGEVVDPKTGLPVRFICRLLRPLTLTPPEMLIWKKLYLASLKLRWPKHTFYVSIHRQYFVKSGLFDHLLPKSADDKGPDGKVLGVAVAELVVITQVTSPDYSQDKLVPIVKDAANDMRDDVISKLGTSEFAVEDPYPVAAAQIDDCQGKCGGDEECPQCELGATCEDDQDCLSGFCVKEVCAAGRDSGSSVVNTQISHAIAGFGAVIMAFLAIMQYHQ